MLCKYISGNVIVDLKLLPSSSSPHALSYPARRRIEEQAVLICAQDLFTRWPPHEDTSSQAKKTCAKAAWLKTMGGQTPPHGHRVFGMELVDMNVVITLLWFLDQIHISYRGSLLGGLCRCLYVDTSQLVLMVNTLKQRLHGRVAC